MLSCGKADGGGISSRVGPRWDRWAERRETEQEGLIGNGLKTRSKDGEDAGFYTARKRPIETYVYRDGDRERVGVHARYPIRRAPNLYNIVY